MGFCPSAVCGSTLPLLEKPAERANPSRSGWVDTGGALVRELAEVDWETHPKTQTPSQEFNRALGGGLVAGSVVLLAGEPGVGKSTLLLQIAQSTRAEGRRTLYVSGEESPEQIKLRAQRLGLSGEGIFLFSETGVDQVLSALEEQRPGLGIVDSIQTLYCPESTSSPGSAGQVREAGLRLIQWAKQRQTPLILAGHVTKDGSVAGPRVLEHMVDVVAHLEAQEFSEYRVVRTSKNRFGSTNEVGVLEMTDRGLADVPDPSRALLSQRFDQAVGAAVTPILEGSRALLLEVQGLTSPTQLPAPRRVANGLDHNRLIMLTAVVSRRAGLDLSGQDVIVNVAGGFRISEPAADLAVALALASSMRNAPLDPGLAAVGEVGLSGELRSVSQTQRRLGEASRLGFSRCLLPETAMNSLAAPAGMELVPARTLRQAFGAAFGGARSGGNGRAGEGVGNRAAKGVTSPG